ncbi:MAG: ZIP family metal transporter [Mycoplasmatales bacterium]
MDNFILVIYAGIFVWGMTALGAGLIFLLKNIKQIYLDGMLGFAAGVMIAASFTSLILPALDYAQIEHSPTQSMLMVGGGILIGTLFLMLMDKILPHLHAISNVTEGPKTSLKRSFLLVLAITLHNIPEGLAVGVAFGAYGATGNAVLLTSAIGLALGIGIQNFPEGAAVSFPLYREGYSKKKSFFYGQLSGIVEPIMVIIGYFLVNIMKPILPFALAFAAGAMMFVVIEELIPESQTNKNIHLMTLMTMVGLVVMLTLDVLLG